MSNRTMDGAVYVQTNESSNTVMAFRRADDGDGVRMAGRIEVSELISEPIPEPDG